MTKLEPVQKVLDVLNQSGLDAPADELIELGQCLIKIGRALKPLSRAEAIKVMTAVQNLA